MTRPVLKRPFNPPPRLRTACVAAVAMVVLAVFVRSGAARADVLRTIDVGGVDRGYLLHLPESRPEGPVPLVLAFHGGGGSATAFRNVTGLDDAADRLGFAVAFLDAGDGTWGTFRSTTGDPADDLAFVDALVDHLADAHGLDASRVFATGLSNGGEFSFLLGLARPGTVAAVAPVGMHLTPDLIDNTDAETPVSVINLVGHDDPLVPYEGGTIGVSPDPVLSSDATIAYLRPLHGAGDVTRTPLPNVADDGTFAVRDVFATPAGAPGLERITVFGGGHTWPGGRQYLPEAVIGKTSRDFDANDVIWSFFAEQPPIPEPAATTAIGLGTAGLLLRRSRD